MNSQAIRSRHTGVYQELYQACPTVVSAPATLIWTPHYAVGPGGIGVVTKLPLRMTIGIEPTNGSVLEFGPNRYYIPEKDDFQEWRDTDRCNPAFLELLAHVAREHGYTKGARIWSLSEVPWYRGLNVDSLYAVPSAAALLIHVGAVDPKELTRVVSLPTEEIMRSPLFNMVFRLAWRLDSILGYWLYDGHTSFASLVDSAYPIVYFREPDPFLFDEYHDNGIADPSSFYNIPGTLPFWGARLNELFSLERNLAWPIDIALVYTGEEGDSRFTYQTRKALKAELDAAAAFARGTFSSRQFTGSDTAPRFLELVGSGGVRSAGMQMFAAYRETGVAHSVTVFKTIVDLFLYGATSKIVRDFVDAQNLCQDILRLVGLCPLSIDRVCIALRAKGAEMTDTGLGVRTSGFDNQGCVTITGPRHALNQCLEQALPALSKETGRMFHCHWSSWNDGISNGEGIRVEQYVQGNIYSVFVTADKSVEVYEWTPGNGQFVLYTSERWKQHAANYDIVFDDRTKKIYIRGISLESHQIHSARQTVGFIRQFVQNHTETLASQNLNASYYSKDRNQMESKIVRPLSVIFKKMTGIDLGFEIHGGLGARFSIRFAPPAHARVVFVRSAEC